MKAMQKNKSEHSPKPQPARAIYGFFLISAAIVLFLIFCLVSYFPETVRNTFGWDYLPDKYWSIALPAYVIFLILIVCPVYISLNITKINDLSSINGIKDEYSLDQKKELKITGERRASIDPVYDIPISQICEFLYLKK